MLPALGALGVTLALAAPACAHAATSPHKILVVLHAIRKRG
jgi:hypothetical protein